MRSSFLMELPPEPKVLEGFVNFVDLDAWYDDRDPSDEYFFKYDQEAQDEFIANHRAKVRESWAKFSVLPRISQRLAMDVAIGSI